MKHLKDIIVESFFDGEEDLMKDMDNIAIETWLKENTTGGYKYQRLKTGDWKINGTLIIKGFTGEEIPIKNIVSVINGGITIEKCPNLTTLDGLFASKCTFDGDLNIANCPKLESIGVLPGKVEGAVNISNNQRLKNIDNLPYLVNGNVYLIKNGKKFKEETLRNSLYAHNIFCSCEEDEANVNEDIIEEAFTSAHLSLLNKQLNKSGLSFNNLFVKKVYTGQSPTDMNRMKIDWKDIDSSNIKEFSKVDATALKAIRSVISSKTGRGIVLLTDWKGNYTGVMTSDKRYCLLYSEDSFDSHRLFDWRNCKTEYLIATAERADGCVVISWDTQKSSDYRALRQQREQSQDGRLLNTPEQYKKIAKENLERYKQMAAQLKIKKNSVFNKIDNGVEDILIRMMKANRDAHLKPETFKGYGNHSIYDLQYLNECIYDKKYYVGYSRKHGNEYRGSNGLLYFYDEYTKAYVRLANGEAYGDAMKRSDEVDAMANHLLKVIEELQSKLTNMGY